MDLTTCLRQCLLVQDIYCQEGRNRKMVAYMQGGAFLMLAAYELANRDVAALLCLMCGLRTGDHHKWAISVGLHPHELAAQSTLRKVTEEGPFSYCAKQRYTSAIYERALSAFP